MNKLFIKNKFKDLQIVIKLKIIFELFFPDYNNILNDNYVNRKIMKYH